MRRIIPILSAGLLLSGCLTTAVADIGAVCDQGTAQLQRPNAVNPPTTTLAKDVNKLQGAVSKYCSKTQAVLNTPTAKLAISVIDELASVALSHGLAGGL